MPPKADKADKADKSDLVSEKLDKIIAKVDSLQETLDETRALLSEAVKRIDALEAKVKTADESLLAVNKKLADHEKTILNLRNEMNTREQQGKLNAIRLHNFPVQTDESATTDGGMALSKLVFNRVLKPVLEAAITAGAIDAISTAKIITKIYRAGKSLPPPARSPPLVIVFADPTIRLAILRYKRTNIPKPNTTERDAGVKKFVITEDLTSATHRLFKELQGREEIEKIWTSGGVIHFTKVGDNSVKKARAVFQPLAQILAL